MTACSMDWLSPAAIRLVAYSRYLATAAPPRYLLRETPAPTQTFADGAAFLQILGVRQRYGRSQFIRLQCRSVPAPDAPRAELKQEENLLVEAVSLLVQRQRETETWVAEQIWQAQERAAATEQHYADLDARLAGIEDQLNRLVREFEAGGPDAAVGDRLARLREQVEGLKSTGDSRPIRNATPPSLPPLEPAASVREPEAARARAAAAPEPAPRYARAAAPAEREREERYVAASSRSVRAPARVASQAPGPGFWDLLGATPGDRASVLLIGAGAVAVLYALLTQLRLG